MTVNHARRSTRRRVLHTLKQTVHDIRRRHGGADPDGMQRIVDEAVREVRKNARKEKRSLTRSEAPS